MSKNTSISNRINIGFALVIVFLLVFATNRLDKRHFETVQNALSTVYKDRVVAQDYVYKMNNIVHKKLVHLLDSNLITDPIKISNNEFETLIDDFANTKLTKNETKIFISLQEHFKSLKVSETKYTNTSGSNKKEILINLNAIQLDLNNLSTIQISESRNLTRLAQKSLDNNNLMSKLEIGFLIAIGILIQFIIFYRVKKHN